MNDHYLYLMIYPEEKDMFVGIYNYTVIITYLSLISAGLGMFFASNGSFKAALFCLLFSGLCDMIDGTS